MKLNKNNLTMDFFKIFILFGFLNNIVLLKNQSRGILLQEVIIALILLLNIKKIIINKYIIFYSLVSFFILFYNLKFDVNLIEFMKTYISTEFYLSFLCIVMALNLRTYEEKLINKFFLSGKILVILGIFQFFLEKISKDMYEYFYRYLIEDYCFEFLKTMYKYGHLRTYSIFSEPSMFGLYCIMFLSISLYLDIKKNKILYIIGVIISFSATAYLGLILLVLIFLLEKSNRKIKLLIITLLVVPLEKICTLLYFRLKEIFIIGTSGYYRIITPLNFIKDMFYKGYIFGIAPGQLQDKILENKFYYFYKGNNLDILGLTVDNIIFMLLIEYGLIFIILLISLIIIGVKKKLFKIENMYIFIPYILFINATGGYNFIYHIYYLVIIIVFYKIKKIKEERI